MASDETSCTVQILFGDLDRDGFSWAIHRLEDWPDLVARWQTRGTKTGLIWLSVLTEPGLRFIWRKRDHLADAGSLLGGRISPVKLKWKRTMRDPMTEVFTLAFKPEGLRRLIAPLTGTELPPALRELVVEKFPLLVLAPPRPTGLDLLRWLGELRAPPGPAFTHGLFFQAKALEMLSVLAGSAKTNGKLALASPPAARTISESRERAPTTRRERLALERVAKAQALMVEHLEEPLNLHELGRRVGCSPFYLSRTFSAHAGCTLQDYQRRARLRHAAELLRGGRHNVTEAALSAGYNSLSHFTKSFREMYGCCPGLYPVLAAKTAR